MNNILDLIVQDSYYKRLNNANDKAVFTRGFDAGFQAATIRQEKKLDAYAAFIAGNITRAELDEALKNGQ